MTEFSAADHAYMARALRLAEKGLFTTQPNPRVGCVIAYGEKIVGEGFHARAGEPHAEVFALREAGDRAHSATAYVTLEPCVHFGKTPPCTDALIAAGVARVVAACEDPNPKVAGDGFAKLRDAGIAVETGLMHDTARELNRGFFSRLERGRPWVRVKLAMSLDGRTALANGESKWITGAAARADVARWRARSSAILTGTGTVRADDPHLTVRMEKLGSDPFLLKKESDPIFQPLRIVLDTGLATPARAHVLDGTAPTLVLHAPDARRAAHFDKVECAAIPVRDSRLDLPATLALLAERGVNELQVEAGATVCGALFSQGLVDELLAYVVPILLGDTARPLLSLPGLAAISGARRLRVIDQRRIGDDWRVLLRQ